MRYIPASISKGLQRPFQTTARNLNDETLPYSLVNEIRSNIFGTSCKLVPEDGFKDWDERSEGVHTMMLELVLREGIGIRVREAAAANAGKEPYRMREWRLVAFFKP